LFDTEQNGPAGIAIRYRAGSAVIIENEGQSPEERAARYLAKAEQARLMAAQTSDPLMQDVFKKLVAEWEYLATYVLNRGL
jgi:hypothetical protein